MEIEASRIRWRGRPRRGACAGALVAALLVAAWPSHAAGRADEECSGHEGRLRYGFYNDFRPLSYADRRRRGEHLGYEADLLTALEALDNMGWSFARRPIGAWPGIWLLPATADYDVVGGGITILASRTRNAAGETAIAFTDGHVA